MTPKTGKIVLGVVCMALTSAAGALAVSSHSDSAQRVVQAGSGPTYTPATTLPSGTPGSITEPAMDPTQKIRDQFSSQRSIVSASSVPPFVPPNTSTCPQPVSNVNRVLPYGGDAPDSRTVRLNNEVLLTSNPGYLDQIFAGSSSTDLNRGVVLISEVAADPCANPAAMNPSTRLISAPSDTGSLSITSVSNGVVTLRSSQGVEYTVGPKSTSLGAG